MQELRQLDLQMKNLYVQLLKYRQDDPKYYETLKVIAKLYKRSGLLISLANKKNINNPYCFIYTDLGSVEYLLSQEGLIKSKTPKH